jgi:hypothetical protein
MNHAVPRTAAHAAATEPLPPAVAPELFKPPFKAWTSAQLLAYYQERRSVTYFAILDEAETRREKLDALLRNSFEFNGERYDLQPDFNWTVNPSPDKEWLILLHKFYYAPGLGVLYQATADERYTAKWLALTEAWIDSVGFDLLPSDVLGRRVQNWIFAHYYFISLTRSPLITPDFYLKFLTSVHDQVVYLCQHLTPARNHRTLELCAIFWAAVVFPEFALAEEWLAFAQDELLANVQTDLLPDGVQIELSTDYHHLVLKNYLGIRRLAALNSVPIPAAMDERLQRALRFALYTHKPDGAIPSLSDGDTGRYLDLLQQGYALFGCEALRYVATQGKEGQPPPARSCVFPEGGYVVLRSGWGTGGEAYADERYLIFDCGPLGAGNHGHLDVLSFEAAAYGRSLIVDPGRYTYDESGPVNWRARFRGTAYHNTVRVDKKDQTRYLFHRGRYRIQGPAPAHELKAFVSADGYDYAHGVARSHEYAVTHERKLFFPWLSYWVISDCLHAAEAHDYGLYFHLAAEAWQQTFSEVSGGTCQVHAPHLVIAQPAQAQTQMAIEPGYVSSVYGVKHAAPVVRYSRRASSTAFHTVLYPFRTARPRLAVEALPVYRDGQPCSSLDAHALVVRIELDGQVYTDTYFNGPAGNGRATYQFGRFAYDGSLLCVRREASGRIVGVLGQPETSLTMDGQLVDDGGLL